MNNYKKRIADNVLVKKLKGKGAVLIEGPKWCGKRKNNNCRTNIE